MWLLVIIAMNINNPADQPGRITIEFDTEQACIRAQHSVKYQFKFEGFKVNAQCQKQSSS
jgi:hypothetical protein